jgi:hypothetical protein
MRRVAARTQPAIPPAEDEPVGHAPSAVATSPQAPGLTGTSRPSGARTTWHLTTPFKEFWVIV